MRGLVLEGPGRIVLRKDLADPVLRADTDAVVAVRAAGLCGSDLHPYEGRERVRPGVVQGHEIVGTVVEVGAAVSRFSPGDRVLAAFTTSCGHCAACRRGLSSRCIDSALFGYGDPDDPSAPALHGGQAEQVRVPCADGTLVAVPASMDDVEAVLLTDNMPTAWYAVQRAEVGPGSQVAVIGLGSVGLCAVAIALELGAASVVAIDPVAQRRNAASALGAVARDPAAADDLAGACSAVVEAAGSAGAQRLGFELTRPGGVLSVIAVQTAAAFAFTPIEAYDTNLTVRFGRAPVRAILETLLPRIAAGLTVPAGVVVTHDGVPLEQGADLYARFARREPGLIKAVFRPEPQISTD